jgi:parallel beta helix pectate lyase-like protein
VTAARPGQTICLASGDYGLWTGTVKPITIRPQSGATPRMGFAFASQARGFTIDGGRASFSQSWGIEVDQSNKTQGAGNPDISTTAKDITIKNTDFTVGIDIDGPTNADIVFNHDAWHDISGLRYPAAVWLSSALAEPSGVTVKNSRFSNDSSDGIQAGAAFTAVDNEFVNVFPAEAGGNETLHTDAIQLFGASHSRIIGNFVHGLCEQGLGAFDGTSANTVEHNVIVGCTAHSLVMGGDADPGSVIAYNTIVGNPAGSVIECGSKVGDPASTVSVLNNISRSGLLLAAPGPTCQPSQDTHNMFRLGAGVGDFNGQPIFVGGAEPNAFDGYKLAPNSPGYRKATDGGQVGAFGGGWSGGPPRQ